MILKKFQNFYVILKVDICVNFLILCTKTLLKICLTIVPAVLVELTKNENKVFRYSLEMKGLPISIESATSKIKFKFPKHGE